MKKLKDVFELVKVPLRVAGIAAIVMLALTLTFVTTETNNIAKDEANRSTLFDQHLFTHLQLLTFEAESGTNAVALKIQADSTRAISAENQKFVDGIMKAMPN